MTREVERELLDQLNEYKGDPVLDNGSFAAGTANMSEPRSEELMLRLENQRYWKGMKGMFPDQPTGTSDFDHPSLRSFLEGMGHQRQADALGAQQGGQYVVSGRTADGHLRAVPRERERWWRRRRRPSTWPSPRKGC